MLSEMNLFDINEDAVYWLRWRREDGIKTGGKHFGVNWTSPRVNCYWGMVPRSAVFSGMTALDFHAWDQIVDILLRQALLLASRL